LPFTRDWVCKLVLSMTAVMIKWEREDSAFICGSNRESGVEPFDQWESFAPNNAYH
jgi:hypothetical protein